jgi:ubiquitin C-terminal hydrolase
MIEHFLKEEQLDGLFTCEKYKTPRKSTKKFVIWRVPQILVIHLKRFDYGKYRREKIRRNVVFPVEGLDLKPLIEDPSN